MDEEKLTAIIGIRIYPSCKQAMQKEAQKKGMTLSDFIFECIEEGYKIVKRRDVKQSQFSEK